MITEQDRQLAERVEALLNLFWEVKGHLIQDDLNTENPNHQWDYKPSQDLVDALNKVERLTAGKKDVATLLAEAREAQHKASWLPIEQAKKESGKEIIGAVIHEGVMVKDPFISFWSPTLGRFYAGPTHYTDMPALPTPPITNNETKE